MALFLQELSNDAIVKPIISQVSILMNVLCANYEEPIPTVSKWLQANNATSASLNIEDLKMVTMTLLLKSILTMVTVDTVRTSFLLLYVPV